MRDGGWEELWVNHRAYPPRFRFVESDFPDESSVRIRTPLQEADECGITDPQPYEAAIELLLVNRFVRVGLRRWAPLPAGTSFQIPRLPNREPLPFIVGLLADLSGATRSPESRRIAEAPVNIARTRQDVRDLMSSKAPSVQISWPETVCGSDTPPLTLRFVCPEDFELSEIAKRIRAARPITDAPAAALSDAISIMRQSPALLQLEAAWRGLDYLAACCEAPDAGPAAFVQVFDVTRKMVRMDLLRAVEPSQSYLFKLLHDDVYGSAEGEPVSALAYGFEIGGEPESMAMVESLTTIAASCAAPLLLGGTPDLLFQDHYSELAALSPASVAHRFNNVERAKLRLIRRSLEARYTVLALPRVLLREAQQATLSETASGDRIATVQADRLWGNPVFRVAGNLAALYRETGGFPSRAVVEPSSNTLLEEECRYPRPLSDALARQGLACIAVEGVQPSFAVDLPSLYQPDPVPPLDSHERLKWAHLLHTLWASRLVQPLRLWWAREGHRFSSLVEICAAMTVWVAAQIDPLISLHGALAPWRHAWLDIREIRGQTGQHEGVLFLVPYEVAPAGRETPALSFTVSLPVIARSQSWMDSDPVDTLFLVLGYLDEYGGRSHVIEDDRVETFYPDETMRAEQLRYWLTRLAAERSIECDVRTHVEKSGHIVLRCRELADLIQGCYQQRQPFGMAVDPTSGRERAMELLCISPPVFSTATLLQKLSYLAGVYARFGDMQRLVLTNAPHKVDVTTQLLEQVGCTGVRRSSNPPGYVPRIDTVEFTLPTIIARWFEKLRRVSK